MESGTDTNTTVIPHQLCQRCKEIIDIYTQERFWASKDKWDAASSFADLECSSGPSEDLPDLQYHDSLMQLREAAESGCHQCSLFVGSLEGFRKTHKDGPIYIKHAYDDTERRGCKKKTLMIGLKGDSMLPVGYVDMHRHDLERGEVACTSGLDSTPDGSIESDNDWNNTQNSAGTYKMLKSWLKECTDQHETCRCDLSSKQPARVLDVDAYPCSNDIRLVHTNEVNASSYATLSYCWGNTNSFVLTKVNYDSLRTRIKFGDLPKTIRDSIDVCRGMSVRYLWIDALCIIQEDGADFNSEIINMGSIFAGSLFTVAAAESSNSESGCFGEPWPLRRKSCIIEGSGSLSWVIESQSSYCGNHRWVLGNMPLSKRGWVFQERFLSPRTIHFTESEIIWECREKTFCQDCVRVLGNATLKEKRLSPDVRWFAGKKGVLSLNQGWKQAEHEFRAVWAHILHPYGTTEFTNIDDRLSALAGLAQFARSQASYGLWLDSFVEELQWYIAGKRGWFEKIRSKTPSWSWLSLRGAIFATGQDIPADGLQDYVLQHQKGHKTLQSAKMTRYPPATPFQQISAVYDQLPQPVSFSIQGLIHSCQLMPYWEVCRVRWTLVSTVNQSEMGLEMRHAWNALSHGDEDQLRRLKTRADIAEIQSNSSTLEYYPDINPKDQGQTLYCLLLKRELHMSVLKDTGLVLQQIDSTRKLFKRVGYFEETIGSKWRDGSSAEDPQKLPVEDDIPDMISKFTIFNGAGTETEAEIEII